MPSISFIDENIVLFPIPPMITYFSAGAKHPTDIAVGPEAEGENDQDEAEVKELATEPVDVTTDTGCKGVSLLHPINTQYLLIEYCHEG